MIKVRNSGVGGWGEGRSELGLSLKLGYIFCYPMDGFFMAGVNISSYTRSPG